MHQLSDIYQDMTRRAMELGLGDVIEHLGGRALRVVTVCSGTESPLLALEMVQKSKISWSKYGRGMSVGADGCRFEG